MRRRKLLVVLAGLAVVTYCPSPFRGREFFYPVDSVTVGTLIP